MDSNRLSFLKVLTTLLEAVFVEGEAEDLTGRVFRGLRIVGQDVPVPYIVLNEDPEYANTFAGSYNSNSNWRLIIQGCVSADEVHKTDSAHNFMADVKQIINRAVYSPDENPPQIDLSTFGISELNTGGGAPYQDDKNNEVSFFILDLNIKILENLRQLK